MSDMSHDKEGHSNCLQVLVKPCVVCEMCCGVVGWGSSMWPVRLTGLETSRNEASERFYSLISCGVLHLNHNVDSNRLGVHLLL